MAGDGEAASAIGSSLREDVQQGFRKLQADELAAERAAGTIEATAETVTEEEAPPVSKAAP